MAANKAEIEITASTARLPAMLRSALKMVQGFAAATTGLLSKSDKKRDPDVASIAKGAAIGGVVSSLATRGLDLMIDQGKEVMDFQRELLRLGIAGRIVGPQLAMVGQAARQTSNEVGVSALDVLKAGRSYMDLAGAQSFTIGKMNLLARAAQATGSSTKDLAGLMYQLTVSMKVSDAEMENTMGGLINQAKDGAIEAKEMAAEFAGILPLFKRFGVVGREGAIEAGAMFQIMRDGANSAGEAGTMLQRVYAGIQSFAPRFEKEGIQVYNKVRDSMGRKVLLPFDVIFKNIQGSEAMKDPSRVKKMFGRTEGWRGILLGDEATRAFGTLDSKIDSTISRLEQLRISGRADNVIMSDAARVAESDVGRIDIAVQKMKNAFAEALTPERVDQIVSGIERIAESMGPLMDVVSRVADAFGAIYNAGKKVRNLWEGGSTDTAQASHYKYTDKDLDILRAGSDTGKYHSTGAQRAAAGAVEAKKAAYDKEIDALIAAERNDRPTPESIKRAVAGSKADMGPDKASTAQGNADRAYLAARADAISGPSYKNAESAVAGDAFAKQVHSSLGPLIDKMGKSISDAIDRARSPTVKVDGNPIAQAVNNAWDKRRRP